MTAGEPVPPEVRAFADGIKLALQELAEQDEDHEVLPRFLRRVFGHMRSELTDGASKWAGRKLLALVATALFTAGVWLVSRWK